MQEKSLEDTIAEIKASMASTRAAADKVLDTIEKLDPDLPKIWETAVAVFGDSTKAHVWLTEHIHLPASEIFDLLERLDDKPNR